MLFIPHCEDAMLWTSQAVDRKLSLKKRILLKIHLMLCATCMRYHNQVGLLHKIMEHLFKDSDSTTDIYNIQLPGESKARIQNEINTKR